MRSPVARARLAVRALALLPLVWPPLASGALAEPAHVDGAAASVGAHAARTSVGAPRVLTLARARVPRGLDAYMPRGGAWERALTAVVNGRFRAASTLFLEAEAELRRAATSAAREPAASATLLRDLFRKTAFALRKSRSLEGVDVGELDGATPRAPATGLAAEARLEAAFALHDLYLADRALHGRGAPSLRARAERLYRERLAGPLVDDHGPAHELAVRARLGLACLIADGDDDRDARRARARLELERVAEVDRKADLVDLVAHAWASIGDADAAFDALFAARDRLPDWPSVAAVLRVSNDLDPLRDDPRFEQLFGAR